MSALDEAWQAALAAEQQAVFGYGLLGPRAGTYRQLAVACFAAHETLRDRTAGQIAAARLTPVAPLAEYPLQPAGTAAAARRLATTLEDACASAWRYLYLCAASTTGQRALGLRAGAQSSLTASALRGARWRAIDSPGSATPPFPGA